MNPSLTNRLIRCWNILIGRDNPVADHPRADCNDRIALLLWLHRENITIPERWKSSDRIMAALDEARNNTTMGREELLIRIIEAVRIDSNDTTWISQDIRKNYLASIIEGRIKVGS